jgi:hypothetical protein
MRHFFIITVDTEGDNLWTYQEGDKVKTENTFSIPRFQELCEQYGFKPVYLTNYEMICDDRFVEYIKPKAEKGLCEVGIHVHAWNNPPYYELDGKYNGNPYLIEYPYEVMREKFATTYNLIKERIGRAPVSHRAGRWTMNEDYFKLLKEFGVVIDCSYTPFVSWKNSSGRTVDGGCDYSCINPNTHWIQDVLEVPMSIRKLHFIGEGGIKSKIKTVLKSGTVWLRPAISTLKEMKLLSQKITQEKCSDHLEFMIHSSELMVGGSPYFKDEDATERLFSNMKQLFDYIEKLGYQGATLEEYFTEKRHA